MSNKPEIRTSYTPARKQFKYRGEQCLNCEHPLDPSDKYCPNCGQLNSKKRVTITDLFDEFFGSLISYDSKLRQTLKALLLKPGKISREYIAGKRASYTNPFRFLLSLCIVYILMIGYTTNFERLNDTSNPTVDMLNEDPNKAESIIDSLEKKGILAGDINGRITTRKGRDSIQIPLDSLKSATNTLALLNFRKDSLAKANPKGYYLEVVNDSTSGIERFAGFVQFYYRTIKHEHYKTEDEARAMLPTKLEGSELWAFRIGKSSYRVSQEPGTFLNTAISRLPFFIFFFLPVFAVFIWILYLRKPFHYMDHLIFSFHCQSLFIILLMFAAVFEWLSGIGVNWIAVVLFSFYLYKAMRAFYLQGRIKTILKFMILNTIFVFLASISVAIFLSGSALTY